MVRLNGLQAASGPICLGRKAGDVLTTLLHCKRLILVEIDNRSSIGPRPNEADLIQIDCDAGVVGAVRENNKYRHAITLPENEVELQRNPIWEKHKNRTADEGLLSGLRDSLIVQESDSYLLNLSARSPHIQCLIKKANPTEPMQSSLIVGLCAISIGLSILATSPASAVDEQCRSIKSDKGRLACFDREASSTQRGNTEARPTTDQ